jgi:DNA-binding transcriptional regulator YdaS (Cro superfamily)
MDKNKYTDAFVDAMDKTRIRSRTIAMHLGASDNSVAQWRSGRRPIPAEYAAKIAHLLGVAPETISQPYHRLLQSGVITSRIEGQDASASTPAGHVAIERLPEFGRTDEPAQIWLPEFMLLRELGATPIERVRWVTQQARTMEPEIKRHALVLIDIGSHRHNDVVDGGLYAYTLWGRCDIRRIAIRRDAWILVGADEDRARTPVPTAELPELRLLGMVIGWL